MDQDILRGYPVTQEIANKITTHIEQKHNKSFYQEYLDDLGISVDIGLVVVIVVIIQLIKKWVKQKYPYMIAWLPVLIPVIVTFFLNDGIHIGREGHGFWHVVREWIGQSLLYTAGCHILYKLILEKLLSKK